MLDGLDLSLQVLRGTSFSLLMENSGKLDRYLPGAVIYNSGETVPELVPSWNGKILVHLQISIIYIDSFPLSSIIVLLWFCTKLILFPYFCLTCVSQVLNNLPVVTLNEKIKYGKFWGCLINIVNANYRPFSTILWWTEMVVIGCSQEKFLELIFTEIH